MLEIDLVSSWEPHCDHLNFPAVIFSVSRMATYFVDFLILVSENLSGFPDKIVAFDLEGLILMKCCFTLTTFMESALFLNKIKESSIITMNSQVRELLCLFTLVVVILY